MRKINCGDKTADLENLRKREKVQKLFWNQVGVVEHINLPKLEDALKKEFKSTDSRFIEDQIRQMQTEARIRIQEKSKVWVKQPT